MFIKKAKIVLSFDERKRVVNLVVLLIDIKARAPRESKSKSRNRKTRSSRKAKVGKTKLENRNGPFQMGPFFLKIIF